MKIIKDLLNTFKQKYSTNEKLIIILAASIFMPFVVTGAVIVILGLYILIKKDFFIIIKEVKRSSFLIIFSFYLLIVSMIGQNWLGAMISVGMIFVFIVVIFFSRYITKELFETIIDVMIVMSVIAAIYGIFEQFVYTSSFEGFISYFDINNKPQYRVHTFFFNANYYAMMIIFVELFCAYKIMANKKIKFYLFAGALNLFAMFLTGSRFAWISLFIALIAMFLINKNYKILAGVLGSGALVILSMFTSLPLIPRLSEYGFSLGRRLEVYKTTLLIIKDKWLLGEGPLTYFYRYPEYLDKYVSAYGSDELTKLGISSQHAHSMFLDPLISFGLIGTVLLLVYLFTQLKSVFKIWRSKINKAYSALIIAVIVAVVTSNLIDYPIFWIQTGVLFLLLLSSVRIYDEK